MLKQAKRKVDFRSRETRPLINRGETMRHPFLRLLQSLPFAALAFQFGSTAAIAQEKKMAQVNGVDNSKMGPYRALAQHVYGDFQKGDVALLEISINVLGQGAIRPHFAVIHAVDLRHLLFLCDGGGTAKLEC